MTWLQAVGTTVLQSNYRTLLYCSIVRVCSENTLSTSLLHLAFLALEKKTVRLKQMQMKWDGALTHPAGMAAVTAAIKRSVCREVMLCRCVSSSWHLKGYSTFIFSVKHPKFFLHCLTLRVNAIQSFKTSTTTCPLTKCHIPEKLNLQQHLCENFKSHLYHTDITSTVCNLRTGCCYNSMHLSVATKSTVNHLCRYLNGLLLCLEWPFKICTSFFDLPF
jgi:hypothetical protein